MNYGNSLFLLNDTTCSTFENIYLLHTDISEIPSDISGISTKGCNVQAVPFLVCYYS